MVRKIYEEINMKLFTTFLIITSFLQVSAQNVDSLRNEIYKLQMQKKFDSLRFEMEHMKIRMDQHAIHYYRGVYICVAGYGLVVLGVIANSTLKDEQGLGTGLILMGTGVGLNIIGMLKMMDSHKFFRHKYMKRRVLVE
jgi:hypothetical protein